MSNNFVVVNVSSKLSLTQALLTSWVGLKGSALGPGTAVVQAGTCTQQVRAAGLHSAVGGFPAAVSAPSAARVCSWEKMWVNS